MSIEKFLQKAIETGEIVEIIYYGGSQPGAQRAIAPISIKDSKLRARCYSSKAVKTFIVEKLKIVNGEEVKGETKWSIDRKQAFRFQSLAELLEKEKDYITDLGWHIEYENEHLSLHRRFKNGKPMKGADVSIYYEEFTHDLIFGVDGEWHEENIRKRQRPWTIRTKNENTKTYGTLEKAAEAFIKAAKSLAPTN